MTVYPVAARTRRALAATRCIPNLCLRNVRTWIGAPARYPSARAAWRFAKRKHYPRAGHVPPEGVPVYFQRSSVFRDPFGHIAYSLGHGKVRTTDYPSRGVVGTVSIDELERRWGKPYVGWADDLNGVTVHTPRT